MSTLRARSKPVTPRARPPSKKTVELAGGLLLLRRNMNVTEIRFWALKRFGIPLGMLLLAGLLAYGGWRLYLKLEPARLAKRREASIEKGDLAAAGLTIRHAFSINPNSFAVMRAAAELGEKAKDPAAVGWRRKLADLQPKSLPAALDF